MSEHKELSEHVEISEEGVNGFGHLLPEIMMQVFEYLPLSDRKNGKIVCAAWYKMLTSRIFLKKERIVCRGSGYPTEEIVTILRAFRCPLHSLTFNNIDFRKWPRDFWEERGEEIRELNFVKYYLTDEYLHSELIEQIITYCINLTHWGTLPMNDDNILVEVDRYSISENVLDILIGKNILRSNFISIKTTAIEVNESWLVKLFTIFPRISKLHLHRLKNPSFNVFKPLAQHPRILDCLKLENFPLSMNQLFDVVPPQSCTMLQELDIDTFIEDDMSLPSVTNLLLFISKLKMLKMCYISFTKRDYESLVAVPNLETKLFHTLLDHCVDLHTLFLQVYRNVPMEGHPVTLDAPLLEKLLKSKIEVLDLITITLTHDFLTCLPKVKNDALKTLKIGIAAVEKDAEVQWSTFLSLFRALKYCTIYIDENTNYQADVLNALAENHETKLVDLFAVLTDEPELPLKLLCLSRFTCMKDLYIVLPSSCSSSITALKSPNLESFHLEYTLDCSLACQPMFEEENEKFFDAISTSFPKLKGLTVINAPRMMYPMIKKICNTLSKLQSLKLIPWLTLEVPSENVGLPEIENLFSSSESLRTVSLDIKSLSKTSSLPHGDIHYDRSRKRILNIAS